MSTAILTGPPIAATALEDDLRRLGFQVVGAGRPDQLAARIAAVPAGERVAVVDRRFIGHRHALRLALTDPRFPAGAIPGALAVSGPARAALTDAVQTLTGEAGADAAGVAGALPERGTLPAGPAAAAPAMAGSPKTQETVSAMLLGTAALPDGGAAAAVLARTTAPAGTALAAPGLTEAGLTEAGLADPDLAGPDLLEGFGALVPDELAVALLATGHEVHRPELGVLTATVPVDPAARAAAMIAVLAVDDEQVRLRSAVKSRDGFFTTFFVSPYSRYLARWCDRRGLTPNQVTTASLVVALVAAAFAATGTRTGFVAAGALLLGSFVLDCTDGQLARYSLRYSTLGAWLDATFDRVKEYAYYAGLALGAARAGDDVWALALGAMVLQTARHVVDFAFTEAYQDATANTSPTAALSHRLDQVGWTVWVRRMIVLPIGERWALIAVLTAATTPRITLQVLLAGSALAACYTTAGRVLRSLTRARRQLGVEPAAALAALADTGPFAAMVRVGPGAAVALAALGMGTATAGAAFARYGSWWPVLGAALYALASGAAVARPLRGALDWLVPPLFRAGEYTVVLVLAARSGVPGALPAAFGLVAAVAYHHYDTVYRIRGGTGAPPRALVRAIGGHEGRTLLVTVAAALLPRNTAFAHALAVLAALVALVVLAESIRFWVSAGAPAVHDGTGEPT